jgi:hypothetical protein
VPVLCHNSAFGRARLCTGRSAKRCDNPWKLVLPDRIELSTSPLPRECSTTELRQLKASAGAFCHINPACASDVCTMIETCGNCHRTATIRHSLLCNGNYLAGDRRRWPKKSRRRTGKTTCARPGWPKNCAPTCRNARLNHALGARVTPTAGRKASRPAPGTRKTDSGDRLAKQVGCRA